MLKLTQNVLEYNLPIKVTPQKMGGFSVVSPVWKDCYAQGETLDEAVLEITAVAQSLIELYKEEGLSIPLKTKEGKKLTSPFSVPIIVAV